MRIVEGPTGTGPATWPRGQRATWHRANGHMAVRTPLPTQTPAMGSEGELDSGQHQAGPGPAPRERLPVAAATHGGDAGDASAAAHASVGQLAGPPGCRPGPLRACRFESCPAYNVVRGGTSRWPATAATFRQALSVQLEWTPACRAGDHGFESRTERAGGRRAVVAAGCQSGLSIRAARVRFPSTAHHTSPHGLAVKDARFSAGRTPVRARLGVPMLSWRNRQTHRLQVAAPPWRVGSTPTESTRSTPTCRNGRRAALRAGCPSGREGSTPSVGTCGSTLGGGTGVQACLASTPAGVRHPATPPADTAANPCMRMKRMWTRTCSPCRRQPVRGRSSARKDEASPPGGIR